MTRKPERKALREWELKKADPGLNIYMDIVPSKQAYLNHGFFWNQHLAEFLEEFSGKEVSCPHYKAKTAMLVRFFSPGLIAVPREYGQYEVTAKFLGEEIAPVGECDHGHIELLLTESGRLVGFADYLLLRWGDRDSDWRTSAKKLLSGERPTEIGVIP